jgi:hypothetical protein
MPARNTEPLAFRRKVLTIYGERGWNEEDPGYSDESLARGFGGLNGIVNKVAKMVTVHSVSYAHLPLVHTGKVYMMVMSVTVVYSGQLNLQDLFRFPDVIVDETVIKVQL